MSSPKKKKMKLTESAASSSALKRELDVDEKSRKRVKTDQPPKEDVLAQRRKNFIKACELVSKKAYFDQRLRFQLDHLPACAKHNSCKHHKENGGYEANIKVMPPYTEESFNIEMKCNMWREALEVCRLCITPNQYLSANVLKEIVEIMLNAHDDEYSDYTIEYLIEKCQQIFELNFSYHPPCMIKSLRKCYIDFLTSSMQTKEKTYTNRSQFGSDKGVVKYCLNRLEYEISKESKDEPLVDKYENMPEDMRHSVKGLHWQKEKFEIYELLHRNVRIDRLFAVLDSIVELFQYDLAIWHSRYKNNLGSHLMRSHKPLMAYFLWSNNLDPNDAVNSNCQQIMRLYVHLIHLQYPEEHIKTMTTLLSTMIQTLYMYETNSNKNYPNIEKYCNTFANYFYKIISEMPQKTIIRILERIKPDYMQYLIGTLHIKELLSSRESDPIKIFTEFVEDKQWKAFLGNKTEIEISIKRQIKLKNAKDFTNYLLKKHKSFCHKITTSPMENSTMFRKFDPQEIAKDRTKSLNDVIHIFYITLDAYLNSYNVQNVQETLDNLNERLNFGEAVPTDNNPNFSSYSVTEDFIKKYRSIFQTLKELMLTLQKFRSNGKLPNNFKVFEKIGLLKMDTVCK